MLKSALNEIKLSYDDDKYSYHLDRTTASTNAKLFNVKNMRHANDAYPYTHVNTSSAKQYKDVQVTDNVNTLVQIFVQGLKNVQASWYAGDNDDLDSNLRGTLPELMRNKQFWQYFQSKRFYVPAIKYLPTLLNNQKYTNLMQYNAVNSILRIYVQYFKEVVMPRFKNAILYRGVELDNSITITNSMLQHIGTSWALNAQAACNFATTYKDKTGYIIKAKLTNVNDIDFGTTLYCHGRFTPFVNLFDSDLAEAEVRLKTARNLQILDVKREDELPDSWLSNPQN